MQPSDHDPSASLFPEEADAPFEAWTPQELGYDLPGTDERDD